MPVNDKKRSYGSKLVDYIHEYKQAFIVSCDNVGSRQMQQIRVALRGSAVVLMGKNVSAARGAARIIPTPPSHRSPLRAIPLPPRADHHPQGDQGLPQEQ